MSETSSATRAAGRAKSSIWELRSGDLPSERTISREPFLRGIENNAVFRICLPRRIGRKGVSMRGRLRALMALRRDTNLIMRDWWLSGLTHEEIADGLWASAPVPIAGPARYGLALYLIAGWSAMQIPAWRPFAAIGVIFAHLFLGMEGYCRIIPFFEPYVRLAFSRLNHPLRPTGNAYSFSKFRREIAMLWSAEMGLLMGGLWLAAAPCALYVTRKWLVGVESLDWGSYALSIVCSVVIGAAAGLCQGLLSRRRRDRNRAELIQIVRAAFEEFLEIEGRDRSGASPKR